MKFFTIGYGGRRPDEFVRMLVANGVKTLADVRIEPQRASMGAYVKARDPRKGIEKLLGEAGIAYVWLEELGNAFREREDPFTPYRELLEREGEARTKRLLALEGPACLLCAEKRAADCHRTIVADWLAARGHQAVALE